MWNSPSNKEEKQKEKRKERKQGGKKKEGKRRGKAAEEEESDTLGVTSGELKDKVTNKSGGRIQVNAIFGKQPALCIFPSPPSLPSFPSIFFDTDRLSDLRSCSSQKFVRARIWKSSWVHIASESLLSCGTSPHRRFHWYHCFLCHISFLTYLQYGFLTYSGHPLLMLTVSGF
jgi:hypothetical protein